MVGAYCFILDGRDHPEVHIKPVTLAPIGKFLRVIGRDKINKLLNSRPICGALLIVMLERLMDAPERRGAIDALVKRLIVLVQRRQGGLRLLDDA